MHSGKRRRERGDLIWQQQLYLHAFVASETDKQPLGSGQDYVEWHHVHAVGLGSGDEQRHYRSLRRGVRFGFAEPFAWGVEAGGTKGARDRARGGWGLTAFP